MQYYNKILISGFLFLSCFFNVIISVMPAVNSLLHMLFYWKAYVIFISVSLLQSDIVSNCHRMIKMSLWSHLFADWMITVINF